MKTSKLNKKLHYLKFILKVLANNLLVKLSINKKNHFFSIFLFFKLNRSRLYLKKLFTSLKVILFLNFSFLIQLKIIDINFEKKNIFLLINLKINANLKNIFF